MAHPLLPIALVRIPGSIGASAAAAFGRNPGSSTPVIVGPFSRSRSPRPSSGCALLRGDTWCASTRSPPGTAGREWPDAIDDRTAHLGSAGLRGDAARDRRSGAGGGLRDQSTSGPVRRRRNL